MKAALWTIRYMYSYVQSIRSKLSMSSSKRTRSSLAVHVARAGARAAVGRGARGVRERRHAARGEHEAALQHVRAVRRVVVCAHAHTTYTRYEHRIQKWAKLVARNEASLHFLSSNAFTSHSQ